MFCTECKGEFKPEISVCPDCGLALVFSLPQPEVEDLDLVEVLETSEASVLPVVQSVLSAAKIPFSVHGEQILASAVGFKALSAKVMVPADRLEEARSLLENEGTSSAL